MNEFEKSEMDNAAVNAAKEAGLRARTEARAGAEAKEKPRDAEGTGAAENADEQREGMPSRNARWGRNHAGRGRGFHGDGQGFGQRGNNERRHGDRQGIGQRGVSEHGDRNLQGHGRGFHGDGQGFGQHGDNECRHGDGRGFGQHGGRGGRNDDSRPHAGFRYGFCGEGSADGRCHRRPEGYGRASRDGHTLPCPRGCGGR